MRWVPSLSNKWCCATPICQMRSTTGLGSKWARIPGRVRVSHCAALRQKAKQRLLLVKCSNKTCFWYQVMNPQLLHRSYFRKSVSLCYIFIFPLCQFSQYSVDCVGCLINTSVETIGLIPLIIHWYSQANKQISVTHILLGKVCGTPWAIKTCRWLTY